MNRNVESHFSELPHSNFQRSTFDRSSDYKTSFNVGDLIPFYCDEVLPGDTFDITTAKVVRTHTLLTPVMDNIYLDTYFFFVPNRLVWSHWKEFCGENSAGAWAPSVEYSIPSISAPSGGFSSGTLADYFGLPVGVEWSASDELSPSALPFRAYGLICNEFFRDENLSDPLNIPLDDANQAGVNSGNYITDVVNGGLPFKAAKYHDYFTSALPAPQKGAAVGIPVDIPSVNIPAQDLPVSTRTNDLITVSSSTPYAPLIGIYGSSWLTPGSSNYKTISGGTKSVLQKDSTNNYATLSTVSTNVSYPFTPTNLAASMPAISAGSDSTVTITVNEMRIAVAYQQFLESLARSGSRYTELLLGLFGVHSPDARLQRPEYLGGNRIPINIKEVTNNAQTETDFLGDLGAKSQTGDVNHDFVKSFTEHGYLIGVMVARYDHSYSQGLEKFWSRKSFTDFYNPMFANLGEVPIYNSEIMATSDNIKSKDGQVFGYQEIWSDYRFKPSKVTGEMRPGVTNTLAQWNLADNYSSVPTLSDSWIREDKTNVDRVLAVTSSVSNQFFADIYIQNKCTRVMPMYSVPGLTKF